MIKRLGGVCAAIGLALGTSACTDGYGYGGASLGYGGGGYYGDRFDDGYGYGGYGYPSNFGWYGDYYYPGAGIYVYDSYRRPYRWNGAQQRYWQGRQQYRGRDWNGQGSWNGFDRRDPNRGDGGRQWQRGRNDDPGQPRSRGYRRDPNAQGVQNTPGQRAYRGGRGVRPDGTQAYSGNPGVRSDGAQGLRNNPGVRSDGAQGFRNNPGVRSDGAQGFRNNPAARGDGAQGGSGNRTEAAPRPGRNSGAERSSREAGQNIREQ